MRDARKVAKIAAKRGIAVAPEEAARAASVTVAVVIKRYEGGRMPQSKGRCAKAGKASGCRPEEAKAWDGSCSRVSAAFDRQSRLASTVPKHNCPRPPRVNVIWPGPTRSTKSWSRCSISTMRHRLTSEDFIGLTAVRKPDHVLPNRPEIPVGLWPHFDIAQRHGANLPLLLNLDHDAPVDIFPLMAKLKKSARKPLI